MHFFHFIFDGNLYLYLNGGPLDSNRIETLFLILNFISLFVIQSNDMYFNTCHTNITMLFDLNFFPLCENHFIAYSFHCMIYILTQRETKMWPPVWMEMDPMHPTPDFDPIQFQGIPQKAKLLKSEPKNVLLRYSFQMPTFAGKLNQIAIFLNNLISAIEKKMNNSNLHRLRIQFPIFCYFLFSHLNRIYFNFGWTWIELIPKLTYFSFNIGNCSNKKKMG